MHKIFQVGMLSFLISVAASATTVNFDFTTNGGTVGGSPNAFGDTRTYTSGIYSVKVSSFALPSNLAGNFAAGQLNWYNTLGLATCNPDEGLNCGDPIHQVDNGGQFDFVLFNFYTSGIATAFDPTTVRINPYNTWDRDVTYWVGNNGVNLSTLTLGTLGMGSRMDDDSTISTNFRDVLLGGGAGNSLLLAARLSGNNADGDIDRFKIEKLVLETTSTTTVTPEPATFGLAGLALVGLGLLRRRRGSKI